MPLNKASAAEMIKKLDLQPLAHEGGYYKETFKEAGMSAIYYLITPESFSALHSLSSSEIWHFYAGDAAQMIQISPSGMLQKYTLGTDIHAGQKSQVSVAPHFYQGTRLIGDGAWALFGCTVSPSYEPAHFYLAQRCELIKKFPQHFDSISRFSRA